MQVEQIMTRDVATISSGESLKDAAAVLLERKVSGLPVLDTEGNLVGIITENDILHQENRKHPALTLSSFFKSVEDPAMTVSDAMTKKVKTIKPTADHSKAARKMETANIKRLPVVDQSGKLVGILSRSDILKVFARDDSEIGSEIRSDVIERILWLDPNGLNVEVSKGLVHLSGSVPTRSDRRILEEMSRRIDGVIEVNAEDVEYEVDDTKRADGPMSGGAPLADWFYRR